MWLARNGEAVGVLRTVTAENERLVPARARPACVLMPFRIVYTDANGIQSLVPARIQNLVPARSQSLVPARSQSALALPSNSRKCASFPQQPVRLSSRKAILQLAVEHLRKSFERLSKSLRGMLPLGSEGSFFHSLLQDSLVSIK